MATDTLEARQARLGRNQALFRAVNDQIDYIGQEQTTVSPLNFLCECADPNCDAYIELTQGEYEAVRRDPTHFFVLPDHVYAEVERSSPIEAATCSSRSSAPADASCAIDAASA